MPKQIDDTQILTAALQLISEKGYEGATTRQIAAAAGINEVTLFRKYGNKANLIVQVIQREADHFSQQEIRYTGNLSDDLERIVTAYIALTQRWGRFIPFVLAEIPRRPELGAGLEVPVQVIRGLTTLFARYQAEQQLTPEPPAHTALALLSPLMVQSVMSPYIGPLATPSFEPCAYVQAFLRGRGLSPSPNGEGVGG